MQDVKEAKIQFERGSAFFMAGEYKDAADAFNEASTYRPRTDPVLTVMIGFRTRLRTT
jgi:hypothetical protein